MADEGECNAWNPGLSSQIPASLQPAITLFRPENSSVDYRSAKELSDFCGLKPVELVSFRVERLIIHDLLVRVTSDLSVPDGPNYEDLGISLRSMVQTIYGSYVEPEIEAFRKAFDEARVSCELIVKAELNQHLFATVQAADAVTHSWFAGLFRAKPKKPQATDKKTKDLIAIDHWREELIKETDPQRQHCLRAVIRVVSSIVSHRGGMVNQPDLVASIATNVALNQCASELVTTLVQPVFDAAVNQEAYRCLPIQSQPVVMNVKGASASGKSTIRPQQRQLVEKLDIPWEDFALISPDYWRKYLLDYDSLGDDYKYAAMLTGQELELIDKKLDRYMAAKARQHQMPHLLIDRFRFDSFNVDDGGSQDSKLLSRFGDRIYLFFMITPPAETVVRAWERGRTTGRYKAVDDLLYHNIEAYTGMPELFLSWVLSSDKEVSFEFLDNSVPKGKLPNTAAFGSNHSMTVLDIEMMQNIDWYRQVNIDADCADDVLAEAGSNRSESTFLERCIKSIKKVQFAEQSTGSVYAVFENGKLRWWDRALLDSEVASLSLEENLAEYFNEGEGNPDPQFAPRVEDGPWGRYTLGDWAKSTR